MTKIGDSYSTTCDSSDAAAFGCEASYPKRAACFGSMTGIFGGKFYVGERAIEYSQILNCKCDRCGLEKAELFEVWDDQQEEFYVSSLVTIPISDDSDISFPGLGMRADCIPPNLEYFLRTGIKTD